MNNIILIGMMGSGKSTVSKSLCKLFSFELIDTDDNIETKENRSINEIFEVDGEQYFRNLEYEVAKSLESVKNAVVSTGGGMILNEKNNEVLRSVGKVIYLRGTAETLFNRLLDQTDNRPLLEKQELREKLNSILSMRKELYESVAHYIVDIDSKDVEQISSEIYKLLTSI